MIRMKSIPRILTLATTILFSVVSQAQIYVSIEGRGDGSSWKSTTTLSEALNRARAGEQIWVRGYENANEKQMYIPDSKDGFKLKSGVQLYGGFAGTETSVDERATLDFPYRLKYRSILSGDISKNDTLDAVNLIFPGNGTRDDNATHVLSIDMNPSSSSGNNNSYPTVVNGFTVTGGHAAAADGKGGGIYIYGDNSKGGIFRIEQCFLAYNYASQGGAVYVAEDVKDVNNNISLISQCVAYNNAAGERSVKENAGGGFYIAGEATAANTSAFNNENGGMRISPEATVTNCTVARNTGAGIDLTEDDHTQNVQNTIIWGNTTLSLQYQPTFRYSAFHEVEDDDSNNNIYVSDKNRDKEYGPFFDAPSLSTGFDREYNGENTNYPTWSWDILEGTVMVNKGYSNFYNGDAYGNEDIKGRPRISGDNIDIGAQEYQFLPTSRRRYVKEGATGSGLSWDDASGDLQRMIDELADNNPQNLAGEVWVAKGEYEPQSQIISATTYSASFRMRDGISVYGGFAGTETTKQERAKGSMPWNYTNETILRGSAYTDNISWQTNRWTLTSDSRHVVWFAPLASENKTGFDRTTILDGVTIKGGYAQGGLGENEFQTDKGAGIYIALNAYAQNCIIKENHAKGNGGAAYINGGRLTNSLVFNNNSDANGGGVYIENAGIILACMITNNSANNGGGVYLNHSGAWSDGLNHPEYLILSTSVVSNNTSRNNGAVYCNKGGVLLQNTITNNNCPTATDNTDANASQTGGLYIDTYALVINSVLWNNTIQRMNIPMYARNASAQTVRFMNSALSGTNNAIWNNTLQSGIINLSESNDLMAEGTLTPDFDPTGMPNETGVDGSLQNVTYMWKPVSGSNLRARGMTLGTLPGEVLLAPEIDIEGLLFAQKPSTGAYSIEQPHITPENDGSSLKIYVNADCTVHNHNGSSWDEAYRSLNEAIAYLAGLDATTVGNKKLEIHVQEGDLWPRYAFTNLDPRTATLSIPATQSGQPIYIYGGYAADTHERTPLTTRSVINGNNDGNNLNEGIYHCITVEAGAKAIIDGFHIINGYAAGEASMLYGAGMLVGDGAEVTVNNCIFENNTAQEGAAIDARNAKLTMNNCVVNNNTNTDETQPLINSNALTMNHVTVVNNLGAAPANMGSNSFATGNSSGNNKEALASVGADGAKNFANPTNNVGATLGFDTYLGGYAEFRPLTSSPDAAGLINKATGTPTELTADITGSERNLGGAPDLGAYEANLPKNGTVIYVTENGSGKMDGSSWENAIAGNMIYDINEDDTTGIATTNSRYIGFYDASSCPFGETSGASKLFFEHLDESNLESSNVNYRTDTHDGVTHVTGANGINIRNQRTERYVGGLQYAVERAAALAADDGEQRYVWVAGGTYTDYKGFVIRDKVDVLGGFPNVGTPGEDDRHPLISAYIPANEADTALNKTTYETIIQIQEEAPFTYNSSNNTYSANNLPGRTRKPVLFQPDVCLPTRSPSGRESSYSYWEWHDGWWILEDYWENHGYGNSVPNVNESLSNTYRWQNKTPGEYQDNSGTYVEYSGATWDGFTIRHGFYTDYKANRDGGAGVRIFRGVTLRNCVVTENYINAHNDAGRGSGIYCDGNNSSVINCFVLNNANNSDESYGGGMYMILGTSYNTMVANNYAKSNGGGIFIEDAMFYNNTVAYNKSGGTGGLHQWTASSGTQTTLKLYNTIFYGNQNRAIGVSNTNNFNGAWNCYVQTSQTLDDAVQAKIQNSQIGMSLSSPFASSNAQQENNYRLAAGTWCLNNGTEEMGKDYLGNEIELPSTDVDFTDRIKDCAVDIGAYESENETNIAYETNNETKSLVYYVTQNGNGIRSGGSIDNAACAMKLQTILTHAGETAIAHPGMNVVVKVAGYNGASFVYHANTLENPNDPQSYTYTIPYGVTLMGGYNDESNDWSDANRKPMTYKTVLSAIALSNSLDEPDINGYHTVTFGEKPESWKGEDKKTIIDGIYLTDGKATAMTNTGNNIRGGGAIVPSWGHVRNCVVRDCQAVEGGGLYLLPGATVSGTAIIGNTAEEGGGIYANATGVTSSNRSHMVSCTITDNEATSVGGGVYMEGGALMSLNAVIWKNTAPSDKNISGEITSTFEDEIWHKHLESEIQEYYPFNYSFVETFELPSNFENTKMESTDSYFANEERILKAYSLLIKSGMKAEYQRALASALGIATADMQYIAREQNGIERVDAGAYAFEGGTLPTKKLITRIFVSQGTEIKLPDNVNVDEYIGRSFYTPLTKLERALEYIRVVRNNGVANDDTKFVILMAGGTYKPVLQRTSPTLPADQRLNSFIVPQGVSIYGGFSGEELYSSKAEDQSDIKNIPNVSGTFVCNGEIDNILEKREYSDFNQNNIKEPWELAYQTILSGNINVSTGAKNAYHVVFSNDGANSTTQVNPIVIDGITVTNGETSNILSNVKDNDEIGRGGGVYSNGVSYLVNRCRFVNNLAVRGGAIYMRDARLTVINSIFAGNGTVDDPQTEESTTQPPRGGAVYIAGVSNSPATQAALYAVNTLWVNNETSGQGGAIGTNFVDGVITGYVPTVSLMNNTFALNKAHSNAVIYHHNVKNSITNTLMWGNVATGVNIPQTDESNTNITYSASDATDLSVKDTTNIRLSAVNTDVNGPRFARPSTVAGIAGNDAYNCWNPIAISILTDAGNGTQIADDSNVSGAYEDWWTEAECPEYKNQYMHEGYMRYAGPRNEDGTQADKPIDIGVYEYQYNPKFSNMDTIYVATSESGLADGTSWSNATSDLRGALVALANPDGGESKNKAVLVKAGSYTSSLLSAQVAFPVSLSSTDFGTSLTIKGSYNESGLQDFSQPTIITTQENKVNTTNILMDIATTADKPVSIDGFTFINKNPNGGTGMHANSSGGEITIKQLAFRGNKGNGLQVENGNNGPILIANTLFADGGTGLADANDKVTVVNATFANNSTDVTGTGYGMYNSVSWNNDTQNLPDGNNNKNIAAGTDNTDIKQGPNFIDPDNTDIYSRDYRIRPSMTLLNQGGNDNYTNTIHVAALDNEKDLANNARLVDGTIDVGAYEYEAALQPIIYVKADLTGDLDGNSWATALNDLQGAIDLAGIYAATHDEEKGYVFVHSNYNDEKEIRISLGNTKVYGGMNDETSDYKGTENIVNDIIGKRRGVLESNRRSTLGSISINANSVVDGFEITGTASVNDGILSTSIADNGVSGQENGTLYNTFVTGDVASVKAINVTATGSTANAANESTNNISGAQANSYVTDPLWNYQLAETSADINAGNNDPTLECIKMVRHSRDLIGNARIRNAVDNGCFETWNIISNDTITTTDKPIGKSVVYVRRGNELKIEKADNGTLVYNDANAFNPGFLLLEHQAGLRGCGNHIALDNFAIERDVKANDANMFVAPFNVIRTENADGLTFKRYSGRTRAGYDYKFDETDGKAWITTSSQITGGSTEGLLIENTTDNDMTLRLYGNSYEEDGSTKSVQLAKYNFNDPWSSEESSGNRFTHKENMSWNLFGSPFLCALNYNDMEYGRVVYGYVYRYANGSYVTVNTEGNTGHIPAFDAVFTQTATLKDNETVNITPLSDREGTAYASTQNLAIALKAVNANNEGGDAAEADDILELNAVPAEESRSDFDISGDGVKWMSTSGKPQLYAVRNSARYSLLSAVSEEEVITIGFTASKADSYEFEALNNENYQTVELTDHKTGKTVDLKTTNYIFNQEENTNTDNRFTLRFISSGANFVEATGVKIELLDNRRVRISGLRENDRIQIYDTSGVLEMRHIAKKDEYVFSLQPGIHIIDVRAGQKKRAASKIIVQ